MCSCVFSNCTKHVRGGNCTALFQFKLRANKIKYTRLKQFMAWAKGFDRENFIFIFYFYFYRDNFNNGNETESKFGTQKGLIVLIFLNIIRFLIDHLTCHWPNFFKIAKI